MIMRPDHKAALELCQEWASQPKFDGLPTANLATAYLDLRQLILADLDAWKAYEETGASEELWQAAKDSDIALRAALEEGTT